MRLEPKGAAAAWAWWYIASKQTSKCGDGKGESANPRSLLVVDDLVSDTGETDTRLHTETGTTHKRRANLGDAVVGGETA